MPRFTVDLEYEANIHFDEIEADTEDEAVEFAEEMARDEGLIEYEASLRFGTATKEEAEYHVTLKLVGCYEEDVYARDAEEAIEIAKANMDNAEIEVESVDVVTL